MTHVPPHGSPGAPHLTYANPTSGITPRRSSWAQVAAGSIAGSHLPRTVNTSSYTPQAYTDHQPSRIPQPISEPGAQAEGGINIPGSWGVGRDSMTTYASPRFPNQIYGSTSGGGPSGFFTPSYLRNSKYMEKLEEAHKAKIAIQREDALNRSSNPGSLSTSSSSVSLHKMAPSHRGMTYEIIERQPEVEDDGIAQLPSKWVESDKHGVLELVADGLDVKFVGPSKLSDTEAAATRTDHAMPPQCGIYYYEVNIISNGKEGMIAVGFSGSSSSLERFPGWEPESWGYHGDDGKSYCCQMQGKSYAPEFRSGDVVGCGVNFMTGCAFFTKNGFFLGNAFRDLKNAKVYPSIGMKRPHAHISTNFGQKPFFFNIDAMALSERQRITEQTSHADISSLHPKLNKDELCKALVAQYLSHDGYVETASAFAGEVRTEATALNGSPEQKLEGYLSVEEDHDAVNRQRTYIRTAILDGDIDKAVKHTNAYFPHVLQDNPQIYFRLRCRKFVELMRQSAELLDSSADKREKPMNGHSAAISDDGFEPDMEIDEPMKDGDDWDRMDTEEADNGLPGLKHAMQMNLVDYARELKTEFKENRSKLVMDTFTDILSMFGYEDPRTSPVGKLLDSSQRVPIAEALNSAILVSLGKSSSTALERLYKQTVVLVDKISEDGGPGSLINVRNILKSAHPQR